MATMIMQYRREPEGAAKYLVFTLVRNPYDREVSSHFAVTWDDTGPTDDDLKPYGSEQERLRKSRAFLKEREKQYQKEMPRQSADPLGERIRSGVHQNEAEGHGINQKRFVDRGRIDGAILRTTTGVLDRASLC